MDDGGAVGSGGRGVAVGSGGRGVAVGSGGRAVAVGSGVLVAAGAGCVVDVEVGTGVSAAVMAAAAG